MNWMQILWMRNTLVQPESGIRMAVLEVTGFWFLKEKLTWTSATMDDLENTNKQIKIIGQITELYMPS
jgi:hypothetical protein